MKIPLFFILIIVGWIPCFGQKAGSPIPEKEKISKVISSSIGWFKEKDTTLLFSIILNDTNYICVNPNKKIEKGFDDFKKNVPIWMNPDLTYVRHEIRELEVNIARCGEVAWFFCRLDDVASYKGELSAWEDVRWTGVLEKREDNWVIVQQHFSYPADR
jgi:hypothetical protein